MIKNLYKNSAIYNNILMIKTLIGSNFFSFCIGVATGMSFVFIFVIPNIFLRIFFIINVIALSIIGSDEDE